MTIPMLMNCPHIADGWCLDCLKDAYDELEFYKQQTQTIAAGYAENMQRVRVAADQLQELQRVLDRICESHKKSA